MDNSLQNLDADVTGQYDCSNLEKLTESYLLLKQKICRTHDLIKQYNDKVKECERLKTDLDEMTKQARQKAYDYNSTLTKVIKLELQNKEYEKKFGTLSTKVTEHEIKIAADQQHIQQLICKIKDLGENNDEASMQHELEKSSLHVKIKELEQELKVAKKSYDTKIKKIEKKSCSTDTGNKTNTAARVAKQTAEIGVNTISDYPSSVAKVAEKSVMTKEFDSVKDDIYPIFCAKCETILEPPPLEKICKMMTDSCPRLIQKISSPRRKVSSPIRVSTAVNDEDCKIENPTSLPVTPLPHVQNQTNHADFMSVNLLPQHTPVVMKQTNYCDNLRPQIPNLMNPSGYYFGLTPSNSTEQNNSCIDVAAMASSLSIITTLQKRVETLETKIKRKLNKRDLLENSNCWQYKRPTPCCVHDINNSLQSNFTFELLKRMSEMYDRKEKNILRVDERLDKRLRKFDLKKVKLKAEKRLRRMSVDSWKVEPVQKRVHQSSLKKKTKKPRRTMRTLFDKSDDDDDDDDDDDLNDQTEDIENYESDLDVKSSTNLFNDTINSNTDACSEYDVESQNEFQLDPKTKSNAKTFGNFVKLPQPNESEDAAKSVEIESDSGIFSDPLESSRINKNKMSSETLSNDRLNRVENDNVTEELATHGDSIDDNFNESTCRQISKTDEKREKQKVGRGRQVLLKRLKNLKRNGKTVKPSAQISVQPNKQSDECEKSVTEKRLNNQRNTEITEDYVPKKKARIAHLPKATVSESNLSQSCRKTIISTEKLESSANSHEFPLTSEQVANGELKTLPSIAADGQFVCETSVSSSGNQENKETLSKIEAPKLSKYTDYFVKAFVINEQALKLKDGTNKSDLKTETSIQQQDLENDKQVSCPVTGGESTTEPANSDVLSPETITQVSDASCPLEDDTVCKLNLQSSHDKDKTVEMFNVHEECQAESKISRMDSPMVRLERYINVKKNRTKILKSKTKRPIICSLTDRFVRNELERLVDNPWESSLHWDVIDKLKKACSSRIIAKCIIDFLCSEEQCNEKFDSSHTPPAPLMTKAQQRITALLIDLDKVKPMVYQFVQAGIEYRLFKINNSVEVKFLSTLI